MEHVYSRLSMRAVVLDALALKDDSLGIVVTSAQETRQVRICAV